MVEVDAGDDGEGGVEGGGRAEDAAVGADGGAGPVGGEVEGIRENGVFPSLESNVGSPEVGVGECEGADVRFGVCGADLEEEEGG